MKRIQHQYGFMVFDSFDEAYEHLLGLVMKHGTESSERDSREIRFVAYKVRKPSVRKELIESLDIPYEWLARELEERLSGKPINPGNAWKRWPEFHEPRLHSGRFSFTNAERISYQLKQAVSLLRANPTNRRTVLSIWDPRIDTFSDNEVPSTLVSQYFLNANSLDAIYFSRSNNCLKLLPADFYFYAGIQQWIANQLGREQGMLSHVVSALFVNKSDRRLFNRVLINLGTR